MRSPFGKRAVFIALGSGFAAASLGLASCSLGLDESLIGATPEASVPDVVPTDNFVPETGDGSLPPLMPEGGVCTTNADCKGTAGCITAKCDIPRKACVLEVCRTPACNSAACDQGMMKCAAPKPYKFRAAQFPVGSAIGCGGQLQKCFAAVYPYVFVGVQNGVVAFPANDPQNAAPAAIPVIGLGFVPTQIIASGSRVFFLGTPAGGGGTSSRVPIAYADVTPDPFATKIVATTILAVHNKVPGDPLLLFPRGNDTALLVDYTTPSAFASVPIEPPLAEPLSLTSTGVGFTAGSIPLAVSGSRLIMGQTNGAGATSYGFVNAAGSAMPMTITDVPIPTATPGTGPSYFATAASGTVLWSYLSLIAAPPIPPPPTPAIRAVKAYFLVADSMANFDPAAGIDIEVYNQPFGIPTVGPVALLDAKLAMVTSSAPGNPTLATNVSFITRTPALSLVKDGMVPRRSQITLPVSQLAAAGSNGLGYILAVDPAAPTAPTVYVFDPGCAP